MLDWLDLKWSLCRLLRVVAVYRVLVGVLDGEGVGPLSFDQIDRLLFLAVLVHARGKRVLLSRQPALSTVINFRSVTGRGDDVGALLELNVW